MKVDDFSKMHVLMRVPKGKIVDVGKLRELLPGIPITTSTASDAVGWLREPVCVFTQVQSMNEVNLEALRQSEVSGLIPIKALGRDDVKVHANGVLWVATSENVEDERYKDIFTVVKVPSKADVWFKEIK